MDSFQAHPFLLFDFHDLQGIPQNLLFTRPVSVIVAHHIDDVRPALKQVQQAVSEGMYAAGYVSYEASPAFDPAFHVHPTPQMPLLWFGLFREAQRNAAVDSPGSYRVSPWLSTISQETYTEHIAKIRSAIARGETYQTNYTMRLQAEFAGDDLAFYHKLCAAQQGAYSAYLHLGRYRILSASPELFFATSGNRILTKPMKGTARRGRWLEEDAAQAEWLYTSVKNRAENVMIVDLLRNDLGCIAEVGSVDVPKLFEIEKYQTVFQMTSSVTAALRSDATIEDVFAALFPCGSITGAPKVSTMKLIHGLENAPREVYCGSIGFITPEGESVFNVAIRTVVIDSEKGTATYGVGGGITWDSTADEEYAEALAKAALLTAEFPSFDLLETLKLEYGAYDLENRHLERLLSSAEYFGIPLSVEKVQDALQEHARDYPAEVRRVRLLVSPEGAIRIESQPLPSGSGSSTGPLPVALASHPIDRQNRFLYHKTTCRDVYERHRKDFPEAFDTLLWNEEGQLTEFTIGNLVLELDGKKWTPPRECGLLAGTLRAELLAQGEIAERVLTLEDLQKASRIWLINSVRGWVAVELANQTIPVSS